MRMIDRAAVAAMAAILMIGGKVSAQNINVMINGQPVEFTGTPPQELNGSVLVPLRGVFEQLGASVQYNPTTKTIFAEKGSTNVSLALGSSTAYVNNQAEQLAQPPQVLLGTTLVPLRFVAESFGAYVEWQPQTSTVQIQTSPSGAVAMGPPPGPPPPSQQDQPVITSVDGRIIQVDDPSNPHTITVGTSNGPVQVGIGEHTKIAIHQSGSDPRPGQSQFLRRGDEVSAKVWPNGNARYLSVNFTAYKGRVITVQNFPDDHKIMLLDNGKIVELEPHATIFEADGNPGDVRSGDSVLVRVRNGDQRAYDVDVF